MRQGRVEDLEGLVVEAAQRLIELAGHAPRVGGVGPQVLDDQGVRVARPEEAVEKESSPVDATRSTAQQDCPAL